MRRTSLGLLGAVVLMIGALSAPAQAVTTGEWYLGYNDDSVAVPGDVISNGSSSTLNFAVGSAFNITCPIPPGTLTYTVPSPVPESPPGGTISIPIVPPPTLACTDSLTGTPITVTIPVGTVWTLTIDVPVGTSPSPWTSPLTGSFTLPGNSLIVTSNYYANVTGNPPCVVALPNVTAGLTFLWSYDPATGTAQPADPAPIAFGVNDTVSPNPTCPIGTSASINTTTEITLLGPGGLIPTVVYQ